MEYGIILCHSNESGQFLHNIERSVPQMKLKGILHLARA